MRAKSREQMRWDRSAGRQWLVVLVLLLGSLGARQAGALGTAFTYQGQLQQSGALANGPCDFRFRLYTAASGGSQVGSTNTLSSVTVTDGLFTVPLDFGAAAFEGSDRWLEIAVACPSGSYTTLSPREQITATPYALFANSVAPGAVGTSQLAGDSVDSTKIANGSISAADIDNTSVQQRVTGTCVGGAAMSAINANGTVSCASAAGDITGVSAGTGLSGGGSSGDVTLNVAVPLVLSGSATGGIVKGTTSAGGPSGIGVQGESTAANGIGVQGVAHSGTAAYGVWGDSDTGFGTVGTSLNGTGAWGDSVNGTGVMGTCTNGTGVYGEAGYTGMYGVHGVTYASGDAGPPYPAGLRGDAPASIGVNGTGFYGVWGEDTSNSSGGIGVYGQSYNGIGAWGVSYVGIGAAGTSGGDGQIGVYGESFGADGIGVKGFGYSGINAHGIHGESPNGTGVYGNSTNGTAVYGYSSNGSGVGGWSDRAGGSAVWGHATGDNAYGVNGYAGGSGGLGVKGYASNGTGVTGSTPVGSSSIKVGVSGESTGSNGTGVKGVANTGSNAWGVFGQSTSGYAGWFSGNVHVTGSLSKNAGSFKIDHPLDPANKYLSHSFVESPDMKNVYDGTIALDDAGEATVELPAYFQALNRDFRYQLTCIGGFAPVYIADEIHDNRFRIAGGTPGLKVSWQVTGIRQDDYAKAHPILVEEDKPAEEKGSYLTPIEHGQPAALSVEQAVKNTEVVAP
ncbi:MAG: hypothetical protein HY699_23770 [Deltaproteobacteria bacterium]|nr:hypothetical protein [Deltaproteobacteria bacterium]